MKYYASSPLLWGPLDALTGPGECPTVKEDESEVIQRWRAKSGASL